VARIGGFFLHPELLQRQEEFTFFFAASVPFMEYISFEPGPSGMKMLDEHQRRNGKSPQGEFCMGL
jgi:hypothetical protein